jgi:hypothetical protein
MSGKVIDLSGKSSPTFPAFPGKKGLKTHLSPPEPARDFTGRSRKKPAKLSDFLKKVPQGYRSFQKKSGKVREDLQKRSTRHVPKKIASIHHHIKGPHQLFM